MKNALILHGTKSSSESNWFPWLKKELEDRGWKVWVPDLPHAEAPNIRRYNEFIFASDWVFDSESVLIGHSSGSVAIFGILQNLPAGIVIDHAILVGSFKGNLGRDDLSGLIEEPFGFEKIKSRARKFTFVHSDDDPFCPLAGARELAETLGGELIIVSGAKHFSVGTGGELHRKIPILLTVIE